MVKKSPRVPSESQGSTGYFQVNSILLYEFVKFGVHKRFWHYNFPVFRSPQVLQMRIQWQICHPGRNRGGKSVTNFQFFKRDNSMKMEIYSGKTLSQANLSNEYNWMVFLVFTVFHSRVENKAKFHSRVENRSHDLFSNKKMQWKKQNGQFTKRWKQCRKNRKD